MNRVFTTATMIGWAWICVATASGAQPSSLQSGIEQYKSARFKQAYDYFSMATHQHAGDAYSSYWMALTLMQLHRYSDALKWFEAAKSFDKTGAISELAEKAISGLRDSGVGPGLQETALKRIRDQADAEGAVQTRNWNDAATGQQETAATLASMLERQRDTEVSKMRRAYYRDKYGNSYPVYSEGDIMSVQGGYDARIDALNREGTEKSASAQAYGRYKSDSLHQAADRLTDQLVGNNLPEGLQLSPVGTNIYVQNYQSVNNYSSPHPPGEMMATQYKLDIDSNVKPQIHQSQRTQDRLSAGQDKLIIDPRKQAPNAATLQVSGKMVVP